MLNTIILTGDNQIDPYPFILLNLLLSCLAALQAPIIMMSQNRQAAKDSLRNQNDYRTDLKSELRKIVYKIDDREFAFFSDNGIFSKDRIDFGSDLLIKTIIKKLNRKNLKILDVGCGYGLIGITLSKLLDSEGIISYDVTYYGNYEEDIITNTSKIDKSVFTKEELEIIDKVKEKFKDYKVKDIVEYSHKEKAFIETEYKEKISYDLALELNEI